MGTRLLLVVLLLWTSLLCIMISTPSTRVGFPLTALAAGSDDDELPDMVPDSDDDELPDMVPDSDDDDDPVTYAPGVFGGEYVLLKPTDPRPPGLPPATTRAGEKADLTCDDPEYSGPCEPLRMPPELCNNQCIREVGCIHGYCGYIQYLRDPHPTWSWACICCCEAFH